VQIVVNKARRRRLCDIAKSRLARNEFEEHDGALERSIMAKYNQLQRRDMPKQAKKKKKSGGAGGGAHVVPDGPFAPPPHIHPAAWGMERDEDGVLGVDEELDGMVMTRQQFVGVVQPCLDAKQKETPGTMYGSPAESIFKGIEVPEMKVKGG
jgi:transcriptional adapter 3